MSTHSPSPLAGGPPPIVIYHRSSGLARLLAWLGWSAFLVCALVLAGMYGSYQEYFDQTEGIEERYHSGEKYAADKVAVIRIEGIIMDGDGYVRKQIDRVREDDQVKAIVVRVDSPGGTVTGSDYIYHHLQQLRKEKQVPMVVSMGSIAASGGYYVAMAVGDQPQSIFAEPTTTTGSIGVIIPHYDLSGLLAEYNIKDDSIASHPRKQMLSMTRPIGEEERAILQRYVDESFARFKEIVQQGRPHFREDEAALEKLATGEIFTARQALEQRLVDELGFMEEAVARACEMAQMNPDEVRVVEYERPATLASLVGFAEARGPQWDLEMLLNLSAPRAYYLATSLPPLVRSEGR